MAAGTRASIRYAKAVLSLATDQKVSEMINNDMKVIANTISTNDDLKVMLNSPIIKTELKKNALLKIFSGLNKITVDLIDVLIANKRLNILNNVAVNYNVLFDKLNGKEKATVTTAIAMTTELEIKVLAKVKELTNKAVELENIVDESILGGFILRVGDKQYNASISNQLNKLKREFKLN
jgi:F-type H+-transporting ATPase subunit delta